MGCCIAVDSWRPQSAGGADVGRVCGTPASTRSSLLPQGCPGPEESCPHCLLSSFGCSTWEHWPPIPGVFGFSKVVVCLTHVCRTRLQTGWN